MSLSGWAGGSQRARRRVGAASLSLLLAAACVKHLPPAPTPEARAPAVQAPAPPAQGQARLVLDVVDGPNAVHRVRMEARPIAGAQARTRVQFTEAPEVLCRTTPCVADLPAGNILLGFPVLGDSDQMEVELVHVGPEPTVYRRALSWYDRKPKSAIFVLGIIGTSLAACSLITGTALLPIGLSKDNDALTLAGAITLGAGAVLLPLGIWGIRAEADSYRPGAAIHFDLP